MIVIGMIGTYPLNHSLLKESRRNNAFAASETVRIAEVRYNLCYSDNVRRETILVGQHRWVQILASVRPFSIVSKHPLTESAECLT
jgi:hypothetical protein